VTHWPKNSAKISFLIGDILKYSDSTFYIADEATLRANVLKKKSL